VQSSSSLPTVVALLLAGLLGACEMKRSASNPLPGKGAPASASPAVGQMPDILKYPWRATRWA
jgi:hypothetical protein